jgi:hypothetical protein
VPLAPGLGRHENTHLQQELGVNPNSAWCRVHTTPASNEWTSGKTPTQSSEPRAAVLSLSSQRQISALSLLLPLHLEPSSLLVASVSSFLEGPRSSADPAGRRPPLGLRQKTGSDACRDTACVLITSPVLSPRASHSLWTRSSFP